MLDERTEREIAERANRIADSARRFDDESAFAASLRILRDALREAVVADRKRLAEAVRRISIVGPRGGIRTMFPFRDDVLALILEDPDGR